MPDKTQDELLKDVFVGVKAAQDTIDEVKGKVDAIDTDKINKAGEDAAKALEEIQKRASCKALDELKEKLATVEQSVIGMRRDGSGSVEEVSEYKNQLAGYLRKGDKHAPTEEAVMNELKGYLAKHTYGADETELELMAKDLASGSNSDGGFFITADRSNTMIERIFETSPLRGVANMETTTSDIFEQILDDDEADCEWVGEVSTRSDTTTPQIGVLKIPMHEIFAQPRATQKILDDAGFDIEGWLARKVSSRIGRKENTAFVVGDGSQKPKGFLSYAAWAAEGVYQRDAIEQINSGTAGAFDANAFINLDNSLIEDYQANATWGLKRATFTNVMQLKDGAGRYLLNPNVLAEGSDKILLGKPVIFMNDMPVVAADALSVVVADFSEFYTIVDRFDIRVLRDPYTSKPFVKFYTTKRTGGAVTNYEAGKIMKLAV